MKMSPIKSNLPSSSYLSIKYTNNVIFQDGQSSAHHGTTTSRASAQDTLYSSFQIGHFTSVS